MDGFTRMHREKSAVLVVFSLVCAMLFNGSLALAQVQTGYLEGRVVDVQNLPMPGTNIVLKGTKLGAVASTEGTFVLRQVPAGSYTLVATFVGYDRVERKVRVEAGQVTQLAITMEQRPIYLEAVEVFGVDKVQEVQSRRVGVSEGAQLIAAGYISAQQASTLADALRKTTSVQVDEEGGQQGSLVYVRGFTGDQVSLRVEGAPKNFNQVRHGGANTIWLEPDMYKGITVVPGVASNIYGNGSLGGVVLLETKDPEDVIKGSKRWGLSVRSGYESNGASYYNSVDGAYQATDKLAVSGAFVKRNTDAYKDGDGLQALLGSTGATDANLLLKSVYNVDDGQRLELSYVGLDKNYTARTTTGSGAYLDPADTSVEDRTWSAEYKLNPENRPLLNLNARFSYNKVERDRLVVGETGHDIWGVDTGYFELENVSTLQQGADVVHEVRYGLDYTDDDILTAYDDIRRQRTQYGVYASDGIAVGDGLALVGSVRYDRFENSHPTQGSSTEAAISPKLHVTWRPFEHGSAGGLSIYGVAGRGFRSPSVHEAYRNNGEPSCGRSSCSEITPNPNLKGEASASWETGFRFGQTSLLRAGDELSFQFGYNNNTVDNLIALTTIDEYKADIDGDGSDDLVEVRQYTNIDEAQIGGFELSLNYAGFMGFAAVTAQTTDGKDGEGIKLANINPPSLNATVGTYLFGGKARVGLDMTSRAERKFIQRGVERRRAGYAIYDIFGSYRFNQNLSLQVRAENAFDTLYSKRSIIVDSDGNDVTTYSPGRNIKLTAGYHWDP